MRLTRLQLGLTLSVLGAGLSVGAAERDEVIGFWSGGDSILEIRETENGLSAVLLALKDARYRADEELGEPGSLRRDDNNPDPALKERLLVGLELLADYRFDGRRWQGRIYDPESGNTYSSRMERDGERLKIRGYIGVPMLGRTQRFEPITACAEAVRDMLVVSAASADFC
jgi:uncharacterized protein (DUF2147 family)